MELVIWMQINISEIQSGSLQKPRVEQYSLRTGMG